MADTEFDFQEMLTKYGFDFLSENYPDRVPVCMDELDEYLGGVSPYEAIRLAFHGQRYGYDNEHFNPNDDYFTFNGYGNLVSIPYLFNYLFEEIESGELLDWCIESGYIEDQIDESDEIDE